MSYIKDIIINETVKWNQFSGNTYFGEPYVPPPPTAYDLLFDALWEIKDLIFEMVWISLGLLALVIIWRLIGKAMVAEAWDR